MVNFSLKFETLSMRRVFKGSRDAASLLVLEKKVFGWEVQIFCE